jgi:hypothetical protein
VGVRKREKKEAENYEKYKRSLVEEAEGQLELTKGGGEFWEK